MRAAFAVDEARSSALRALNYSPEVEVFRQKRRGLRSVRLGSLLAEIGPAYGSVFTRLDCHPSQGVELVSQTDMFATEPMGRVIRRDSMPQPQKHEIKRWQVLIAGAGTLGETELFGRSIIADRRLAGKYVGPHAMVLDFREPDSDRSLFAYAFLAGRIGVRAIRSASYGTKILGIRSDILANLQIPLTTPETEARVAALVRKAVAGREQYLLELRAARQPIQKLPEMVEARGMCEERKARCVAWDSAMPTLTAWTYASTGGALGYLQKRWAARLGTVLEADGLFNGPRFSRVPCTSPHGIPLLSQRDLFCIKPVPRRIVRPIVPDGLLFVPEHCILMGSHGQLSDGSLFARVELAAHGAFRSALTQDLLRILVKPGYRELVYAFLSTSVGQSLARGTAIGTSIPSVHLALLLDLPLPELPAQDAKIVRRHVAAAIAARVAADAAEAEAIRIVEEEVLPPWLD